VVEPSVEASSGAIGFVGLVVPHIVRAMVGPRHRRLLPASALLGAIFLVWADVVARSAFAPVEVPVGVMTILVVYTVYGQAGAPGGASGRLSSAW